MKDEEIQALLKTYREGKCTDDEVAKIHLWYDGLNRHSLLSLGEKEKDLLEVKLLRNILDEIRPEEELEPEVYSPVKWWTSTYFYSGVAAALIISLSYLLYFQKPNRSFVDVVEPIMASSSDGKLITAENKTHTAQRITLEDKTVITLSPGGRIIYPDKFSAKRRDVQLIGDAFFEVTKNPEKPFFVFSGRLVARVLGTSFRITTKTEDKAMEVEVITGKISVFENNVKNNNGVILTPNQRVTFFAESGHLMTSLVEKPVAMEISAVSPKMIFNNTQLTSIISDLQKIYGIEIVLANDQLANCVFTGDISDMPLYEKLDLICKANTASYEIKGTRILINGAGCEDPS